MWKQKSQFGPIYSKHVTKRVNVKLFVRTAAMIVSTQHQQQQPLLNLTHEDPNYINPFSLQMCDENTQKKRTELQWWREKPNMSVRTSSEFENSSWTNSIGTPTTETSTALVSLHQLKSISEQARQEFKCICCKSKHFSHLLPCLWKTYCVSYALMETL